MEQAAANAAAEEAAEGAGAGSGGGAGAAAGAQVTEAHYQIRLGVERIRAAELVFQVCAPCPSIMLYCTVHLVLSSWLPRVGSTLNICRCP